MAKDDVIARAKKRAESAQSASAEIYRKARSDLRFLSDEPGAQWEPEDYQNRIQRKRPVLEIDQLKQFVNQVANDAKMNTPNITVIPHAGGADVETAEIIQGIIKDIEYYSNADSAYDLAVTSAIKCSVGFIRLEHKYVDEQSFDQELCIKRVPFPLSVYLDGQSTEIDGSDAKYAFVFEDIPVDDFKERYPNKDAVSFEASEFIQDRMLGENEDTVRIVEYFELIEKKQTITVDDMGNVVEGEDGNKKREVVTSVKVMRYVLSGADVLEESVFPGKYIPIVPVYGEESFIDGKKQYHSLIRKSKDPQRRYNYWASTEGDLLMRAPKGMFLAAEGTTEDYASDYLDSEKSMVVRYRTEDAGGKPANPPQYIPPPQIPSGIVNAMGQALEDIKSTMGLYNAFLGQKSNETSGVAINARKQEGDRAVFHFADNLTKSITHLGQIIVYAMPDIYDTPRIVKMVSKEGNNKDVGINGMVAEGQKRDYYITEGIYNVRVVTGPNYATQRQQAAEFYQKILQTNIDLMPVIGDLAFEHMDFPGSQQVATRLRKTMDPKLLEEGDDVDPAVLAAQQKAAELEGVLQAMQAEMQTLQQQLDNKQGELQIKAGEIQLKGQEMGQENATKQYELEIKAKELMLKEQEIQQKFELENKKIEADIIKTRIDAKTRISPEMALGDTDLNEGVPPMVLMNQQLSQTLVEGLTMIAEIQAQGNQAVVDAIQNPPPRQIIRDANGNIAGVS